MDIGCREEHAHNHGVKAHHRRPLGEVHLPVGDNVVDEEARAEEQHDLEVVYDMRRRTRCTSGSRVLTEQHVHRPGRPPSKQDKERRPAEHELDANVDRPPVIHDRWFEAFVCIPAAPAIEAEIVYAIPCSRAIWISGEGFPGSL